MNHTLTRLAACVSLGMAAWAAAPMATAATVSYTFEVTLDGTTTGLQGSFSFDDKPPQGPGTSFEGDVLYELSSFHFDFGGDRYDALAGGAVFSASTPGHPGQFLGLEGTSGPLAFTPQITGVQAASFLFDDGPGQVVGGTVTASRVPEPATAALLAIALLGAATARRVRARR